MAEDHIERMKRLSAKQENIRNIATSAHIHHGKCVAPATRLHLTDGQLCTAEQLYAQSQKIGKKVQDTTQETVYDITGKEFSVFSLNKETGRMEKKEISHAWKLAGDMAIKVTLRTGLTTTTTPEHKYLVLKDMNFVEKEAGELKLGDRVICARKLDITPTIDLKLEILERLARFPVYARLTRETGDWLLQAIQQKGITSIAQVLGERQKSFYHGAWQHRYRLNHLLTLTKEFNINQDTLYNSIDTISFRSTTKSTLSIRLPHNMEQFFFLAGLLFGDGSAHRFVVGKPALAQKFIDACTELGITPISRISGFRTPEIVTNKALHLLLHALFEYPLKQKSHTIKVSDFLARASNNCVASFLRAYFDCDGTVEKSRRAISLTSVSKEMLKGVQLLLLRFGCVSIVQNDTIYLSGISARTFATHIGFSLTEKQEKARQLASKTQGSTVADTIPFSHDALIKVRKVPMASIDHHYYKYEQEILTPTVDTVVELKQQFAARNQETTLFDKLTTGDLAFIEVISLESVHEPVVYDFSVPDHKNFVAEGMVIHNTAFTDNLIAAAGLMSEKHAGSLDTGMMTWQHADEQERLMTVDSANVSMIHNYNDQEYLVNLIDTPGHIDFGGNVTRAMRAVDGTVVLVCASEGIMPQTETVLKQALRERVKPVLFINKVDRLIKEMQYTPEKMQERFIKIILEFNRLIEQIAETDFKQKWKVNIQDGSVAFGSARDNWALSIPYMQKKGVTFKEIYNLYNMTKEEQEKWAWEKAPLHDVILDMVIKHLPNPLEAQKYRIPKIWHGDLETQMGKDLLTCNPNGKLSFVITRILIEPKSGREISAGRLYSGTMKNGTTVYLNNAKQNQRVAQVFMYKGIKAEIIEEVPAGNILAIAGVSGNAGETITLEPEHPFEELKHIFEPVISKAIKPEKPQDLSKLVEVLRKVQKEDPSIKVEINLETGENLLHGMGELHLEIIENRIITEKGVKIKTSPPIVVYRETVTKKSGEMEGKSPNKHNKLYMTVEPLDPRITELIKNGEINEGRLKKKDIALRDKLVQVGWTSDEAYAIKAIYKGSMFVDETRGNIQLQETMELVLDGFEQVMDAGPLAREPMMGIKVTLTDAKLHEDNIHRGPAQMYPCVRESIKLAIMGAGPVIYEPMQIHVIEAPVEYTGDMTKLVMNKRGQVLEMNQEGNLTIIRAKLPVGEMLGWSSDLRSATGGRGQSSLADQTFEKAPNELQPKIINSIVQRKGLTEGMLGA